jgi:hypothetical protein
MSRQPFSQNECNEPLIYQIRVKGHLGSDWAEWFGSLTITQDKNGDSLLNATVLDQAALHGLLKKVRDLGLVLISVNPVEPTSKGEEI